jgi:hypothetical protein
LPANHVNVYGDQAYTIARPTEITFEIKDQTIKGTATSKIVLGFETNEDGDESAVYTVIKSSVAYDFDDFTKLAASRAVDNVNADGILITSILEDEESVLVFTSKRKVTVIGKPLFMKSFGIVSAKRADMTLQDKKEEYEYKLNKEMKE